MAVFSGVIRSNALAMDTQLHVILPYDRPAEPQQTPCKVIYLLHGMGENSASWTRYTFVEQYARSHGLAVIMPEVQRSFYQDMKMGLHYFTYVAHELPKICSQMFNISQKREDTFIAGLSMGGFGAAKIGLSLPEQYAGVASFSGSLDLSDLKSQHLNEKSMRESQGIFGLELELGEENDIYKLGRDIQALPKKEQPRIIFTCGKQDFLYTQNVKVKDYFLGLDINFRWETWDGIHDWFFWDSSLRLALDDFCGA